MSVTFKCRELSTSFYFMSPPWIVFGIWPLFCFYKTFFLKFYETYFYSSCNGIIEVIVPIHDILFIKIHGRNIYLVLEPEGLYFSKFCFFIFVFVWCNPLEIVNSDCPSFLLQDACQKAQRHICGSVFIYCTSFVLRAISFYAPVLFSLLFFSSTSNSWGFAILYVSCKLLYILQELCRTLKDAKLKIRCIWILVPKIHTFLIAPPQRALYLFPIIWWLFRDLCLPDLTETSPWNAH